MNPIAMPRNLLRHYRICALRVSGCVGEMKAIRFGFKRQITLRGGVVVDSKGTAHFVHDAPLSFWTFFDVFAVLAIWVGGLVGLLS